jgi:hypothetical protein
MSSMQWGREDVTIVMAGSWRGGESRGTVNDSVSSPLTPCASPEKGGEPTAPEPAHQQAFPPLTTQASNLFQAVVAFVGDGCGLVDDATYRRRLEICRPCDRRNGDRCSACGCWINVKARGRVFSCPIGHWQ